MHYNQSNDLNKDFGFDISFININKLDVSVDFGWNTHENVILALAWGG